jgi:serine/threonine-protein kinase HipA
MISKHLPQEAYVWVWLPEATEPIVAGLLSRQGGTLVFNYGKSYLERSNAGSLCKLRRSGRYCS